MGKSWLFSQIWFQTSVFYGQICCRIQKWQVFSHRMTSDVSKLQKFKMAAKMPYFAHFSHILWWIPHSICLYMGFRGQQTQIWPYYGDQTYLVCLMCHYCWFVYIFHHKNSKWPPKWHIIRLIAYLLGIYRS